MSTPQPASGPPFAASLGGEFEIAERLRLALTAADLGDWSWEPGSDAVLLSQRAADIFGISAHAPISRSALGELVHPDDREAARLADLRASLEGGEYDIEYRLLRPNTSPIWVAAKGRGAYDGAGRLVRMLGVVQDITPRKLAEQERDLLLQKVASEHVRLANAFVQSPAFVCILRGRDHVFEFVNDRYYQLIGRRDILNQPLAAVLPELAGQGVIEILDQVFAGGQAHIGKDVGLRLQRAPGQPLELRHLDFVYQPLLQSDGSVAGIFVHGIDLTEKKRADQERELLMEGERAARAEAERASLLKDEFLATLSHELRTPLNAILGWAQILRGRAFADADLAEGLAVIERSALVQAQLIEDLLDMSRIISGKVRLDVQVVDLQEIIQAALASVRHAAEAKEIRLHALLDPLAGPVRGDPGRLQQCFWNLISNAIKFTPKGGRVQVALARVNSHVEISVTDNGNGIAPEFLPHVFERFRQADSSTTRLHSGLGLGLSIVKHLAELHGGAVRAQSGGQGQGSSFCFELPLAVVRTDHPAQLGQHPRGIALHPAAPEHPSLAGIAVVVLDDELDALDLIRRVLEACGAKVFTATSASSALELVRSARPHMILSDIGMPEVDGYEFIRRVRALPAAAGGRTPAAALTAFARAEDRTRALRAGFQTHIAKPVEPAELTAAVASLAARD